MAVSPQQVADRQGETHYIIIIAMVERSALLDLCGIAAIAASCLISFIPGRQLNAEGVNNASSNMWRVEAASPLKCNWWPMTLYPAHAVMFITRVTSHC